MQCKWKNKGVIFCLFFPRHLIYCVSACCNGILRNYTAVVGEMWLKMDLFGGLRDFS